MYIHARLGDMINFEGWARLINQTRHLGFAYCYLLLREAVVAA